MLMLGYVKKNKTTELHGVLVRKSSVHFMFTRKSKM